VVLATIRNASPIPPGAVVDKSSLDRRAEGLRFKYLLEKVDGRWKLAQIYVSDELSRRKAEPNWRPQFRTHEPMFPSFVSEELVMDPR